MTAAVGRARGVRLASRWDVVDGCRIHARVTPGAGSSGRPVVVLVHGLVISSRYMIPTARLLGRSFDVLAPDLPGFGRSDKPDGVLDVRGLALALLRWIDAVGLQRVALVGNSLGCQILTEAAAAYPARFSRVVLAGPTMDRNARHASVQIARWLLDWTREHPWLAVQHLRDYQAAGIGRALRTFRAALDHRIERVLPRVLAPALVVRGARDAIVPQRWAEEVSALLPDGRLTVIPGAPHVVNFTTAHAFVDRIVPFLAGLSDEAM